MKHLFQGEERGFWGKEKINSLGWSYYFLFILLILFPAYFPDFNLSYSFSILLPSIFKHVLHLFSQCLIFQTPRSIASNQSYLHYILSVTSLKHLYEYCFRETMVPIIMPEAVTVKVDIFEMRAMKKQYDG